MRRTESDSRFSHSLAQPGVLKYGSCHPYHFFGTVDPQRRAGCNRAFGCLREIVGVGSDQYRHACRASLDQVLTAVAKQASPDEGEVASPVVGCHFTHTVAEHDVAVGIERRLRWFAPPPRSGSRGRPVRAARPRRSCAPTWPTFWRWQAPVARLSVDTHLRGETRFRSPSGCQAEAGSCAETAGRRKGSRKGARQRARRRRIVAAPPPVLLRSSG